MLLQGYIMENISSENQDMSNFFRQVTSFVAPVFLCIIIPYMIVASEHPSLEESIFNPEPVLLAIGLAIFLVGLVGFILSVRMIIQIGNGTIMPWDPTRKLVTGSMYSYVRNPMILSVILVVLGEAFLFASFWIGAMAVFFYLLNTVYFVFSEEPGLEKRFGEEYLEYKRNVPRWIPRLRPWKPGT